MYGASSFEFKILVVCPKEKLFHQEAFYIAKYNSYRNGYNSVLIFLDDFEKIRFRISSESRRKMSLSAKKRRHSEHTKKLIGIASRETKLGTHRTVETKKINQK